MLCAGPGEHPGHLRTVLDGGVREPLSQLLRTRIHPQLATGFRIDQPEFADVGDFLFARVLDLDGDDRVTARELDEGTRPVSRTAEVREPCLPRARTRWT